MSADSTDRDSPVDNGPLQDFSNCHVGILEHFERLGELPGLLARGDAHAEVRQIAMDMRRFFREVVIEHHAEEEQELFPAVIQSAEPGGEAKLVKALVDQLVGEHRKLEALWKQIEPDMKRLAKGKPASLDTSVVEQLSKAYVRHAQFEEKAFLPLSAKVLSKNDQSALGLSLHMRHSTKTIHGYI
jgi:hemerythrin-like domain-containing protein